MTVSLVFEHDWVVFNETPTRIIRGGGCDKFGQTYHGSNGSGIECISPTGVVLGSIPRTQIDDDWSSTTGLFNDAWNFAAGHLIGGGEYILFMTPEATSNFGAGDVELFALYQCRDGQVPLIVGGGFFRGQQGLYKNYSVHVGNTGQTSDPIIVRGQFTIGQTGGDNHVFFVIPSIDELISGDFSAWWTTSTASKLSVEFPRIELHSTDGAWWAEFQDRLTFKNPTKSEICWFLNKNELSGTQNVWAQNNLQGLGNETGVSSFDLGTILPSTYSPTGSARSVIHQIGSPTVRNNILSFLPDDENISLDDGVTTGLTDNDILDVQNVKIGTTDYLLMVMPGRELVDQDFGDPVTDRQMLVNLKVYAWNGTQYVIETDAIGIATTGANLGATSTTARIDVTSVGTAINEDGDVLISFRTSDTTSGTIHWDKTFRSTLATIQSSGSSRRVMSQIL